MRKFQVAVIQLGVYLETFLQAVMSVSHVVQLKFHVAVVQLGVSVVDSMRPTEALASVKF